MVKEKDWAFSVYGPFNIPVEKAGGGSLKLSAECKKKAFWDSDSALANLKDKSGVYVFAIKTKGAKNPKPFYVGQTGKRKRKLKKKTGKEKRGHPKRGFKGEVFTTTNVNKYNDALNDYKTGKAKLYLITKVDGKVNRNYIEQLETFLINVAAEKNPQLRNTQKRVFYKWRIKGVFNAKKGEKQKEARELRAVLGLEKVKTK